MAGTEQLPSIADVESQESIVEGSFRTPALQTPPRVQTPPPDPQRKSERKQAGEASNRTERGSVSAIDPNALNKLLLKEFEDAGKHRDITPAGSPSRKRQRMYGDR